MKVDKNKELMLAAGSKTGAYDPEAPDQWKWVLLHGESPTEVGMAWIKSKTTAWHHESPFCVDEHGKPLYIPHMAADCGWEEQTARNVLTELAKQGRARFNGHKSSQAKRIWYCADIPQASQPDIKDAETESEGRTKGEQSNSVQSYWPTYLADFIEKLPNDQKPSAKTKWEACLKWRREFIADGMAALRTIADRVEDTTLLEIGLPKKRLPKRDKPEAAPKTKWVQVKLFEEPNFVQSCDLSSYKVETDFVDARAVVSTADSTTTPTTETARNGSAPPSSSGVSSSSISQSQKKATPSPSNRDDDAKPKTEYATPRDEVKAIYYAKTETYPPVPTLDRIEATLTGKGETWESYLAVLKPHLGNEWKNPGGFLTHMARTGFAPPATPPMMKPKAKCPTCLSDNQRGAILQAGAIVACPVCSTAEWREEMEAKLNRPPLKTKGAAGDD